MIWNYSFFEAVRGDVCTDVGVSPFWLKSYWGKRQIKRAGTATKQIIQVVNLEPKQNLGGGREGRRERERFFKPPPVLHTHTCSVSLTMMMCQWSTLSIFAEELSVTSVDALPLRQTQCRAKLPSQVGRSEMLRSLRLTLSAGTNPRTSHHRSPGRERWGKTEEAIDDLY